MSEVRRFEAELVEYFKGNHPACSRPSGPAGALPGGDELDKGLASFLDGFDTGKVD